MVDSSLPEVPTAQAGEGHAHAGDQTVRDPSGGQSLSCDQASCRDLQVPNADHDARSGHFGLEVPQHTLLRHERMQRSALANRLANMSG